MNKCSLIHKLSDGRFIVVLSGGWRNDDSCVIEARNEQELRRKIAEAVRIDDRWVTINGAHVLIGGNGRIKYGAGGKFNNMKFGAVFADYAKPKVKGRQLVRMYGNVTGRKSGKTIARKGRRLKQVEKAIKIKKASEAKEALKKLGFYDSDIAALNDEVLVANVNQLGKLEHKFGILKEVKIKIQAETRSGNASVANDRANPYSMRLNINPQNNASLKAVADKKAEMIGIGWSMPCAKENLAVFTVTHEYGHIIVNALTTRKLRQDGWNENEYEKFIDRNALRDAAWANTSKQHTEYLNKAYKWYDSRTDKIVVDARREICKIAKITQKEAREKGLISRYGQHNPHEWFAEVFANSQLGEPNALGKAMNIWLEQKGLVQNG